VSDLLEHDRADVGGVAVSVDHYIGGRRIASADTFEDRSPLDWTWKLADVSRGDASVADLAVGAATEAFPAWAALAPSERGDVLRALADLIDAHVEDLALVECLDMAMLHESLRLRVIARGRPRRGLQGAGLVLERHDEPRPAAPGRSHRGDHTVERPLHALHLEMRAGVGSG
jgi:hypothetical protein